MTSTRKLLPLRSFHRDPDGLSLESALRTARGYGAAARAARQGGGRFRRRHGGCVIDVESNEIVVATGLAMPHSCGAATA